jgi:hypothetical protein
MTLTPDHESLEKAYEAAAKALMTKYTPPPLVWREIPEEAKQFYRNTAKAAITAFLSSLDGYKFIAREPTKGMLLASRKFDTMQYGQDHIWHTMFDAAPDITKKGTE